MTKCVSLFSLFFSSFLLFLRFLIISHRISRYRETVKMYACVFQSIVLHCTTICNVFQCQFGSPQPLISSNTKEYGWTTKTTTQPSCSVMFRIRHVRPYFAMFYNFPPCSAMFRHFLPFSAMFRHVPPSSTMFHNVQPCLSMFPHRKVPELPFSSFWFFFVLFFGSF